MEQYIKKSDIVTEIKRRISILKANESVISMLAGGMFINEFKDLLSFINSLEVKEVRNNLWKSADGDDLPEIDREVIALLTNGTVCFAHRPNPNGWDGRNILTGEVNHYTPKTYDNGGWNGPDVKWWLDLDLPKMEE